MFDRIYGLTYIYTSDAFNRLVPTPPKEVARFVPINTEEIPASAQWAVPTYLKEDCSNAIKATAGFYLKQLAHWLYLDITLCDWNQCVPQCPKLFKNESTVTYMHSAKKPQGQDGPESSEVVDVDVNIIKFSRDLIRKAQGKLSSYARRYAECQLLLYSRRLLCIYVCCQAFFFSFNVILMIDLTDP